jgi:hypothetical protein
MSTKLKRNLKPTQSHFCKARMLKIWAIAHKDKEFKRKHTDENWGTNLIDSTTKDTKKMILWGFNTIHLWITHAAKKKDLRDGPKILRTIKKRLRNCLEDLIKSSWINLKFFTLQFSKRFPLSNMTPSYRLFGTGGKLGSEKTCAKISSEPSIMDFLQFIKDLKKLWVWILNLPSLQDVLPGSDIQNFISID